MRKLYEWEKLFSRRQFIMIQGVDYSCSTYSMDQQIRNAATKHGVKVSISEGNVKGSDCLVVSVRKHKERKLCRS